MSKNMNESLLCRDCTHSRASWFAKLTKLSYGYTCHSPESWTKPVFDPVLGVTTPGSFSSCRSTRGGLGECGPEAKLWKPSSPKHLFLYLKHK